MKSKLIVLIILACCSILILNFHSIAFGQSTVYPIEIDPNDADALLVLRIFSGFDLYKYFIYEWPFQDSDGDGVLNGEDGCPSDPNKAAPGICGCGIPETDSDGDGVAACNDCDDNDAERFPGNPEICDGKDNDCDGKIMAYDTTGACHLFVTIDGNGINCTADDPCGSIQEAVELASSENYIHVGAGTYYENVTISNEKTGLTITGAGVEQTVLKSAGGTQIEAPAGVPADIVLDVFAPDVTIQGITVRHPEGKVTKRDIGIFIRPPANNVQLKSLVIERNRTGSSPLELEPTTPGSRGVLVFRAKGTDIRNNLFKGNYEDHIHLPASNTCVTNNTLTDATRLGIVVIQETDTSDSTNNVIIGNSISNIGSDGIQIQGDLNLVQANEIKNCGGAGVHLCGPCPDSTPTCVAPGQWADAIENVVQANSFTDNALDDIVDCGTDNIVR